MSLVPALRLGTLRVTAQLALSSLDQAPARHLPVLQQVVRGADYRALRVRSALNSPAATHMGFWSINPYVGCEFGCSYCYARDTHRFAVERAVAEARVGNELAVAATLTRLAPAEAFERHILVKDNIAHVLARTLQPSLVGSAAIVIGTATDPYQPAERRFGVTRSVLEALLSFRGLSIGVITKSPLIIRDIPILARLAERHSVKVHISLASADRELIRRLEARSPAPAARLRALECLSQAGVDAGLLIAPIVPLLTDGMPHLRRLFELAIRAGARRVHGQPLRLAPTARGVFLAQLRREFPELIRRYERHYARSSNAAASYQVALRRRIRSLQEEFGLRPAEWEEADSEKREARNEKREPSSEKRETRNEKGSGIPAADQLGLDIL
jgi:DNA repair photolyase